MDRKIATNIKILMATDSAHYLFNGLLKCLETFRTECDDLCFGKILFGLGLTEAADGGLAALDAGLSGRQC